MQIFRTPGKVVDKFCKGVFSIIRNDSTITMYSIQN
jgi:hypothetical protein